MDTTGKYVTFEEELAHSGKVVYTNVGVSMMPLLREGRDLMVIHKVDAEKLHKYDAVLYKRPNVKGRGTYVLHRILRICSDGRFWIVGDNCTSGEVVSAENILGVLSAVQRGNKTVSVNSFRMKLYVFLWCAPYPIRFFILRVRNLFMRSVRFIKRKVNK